MGKKLVAAFALVALMAVPAFASVQNVKVGGELNTTSVSRNNFTSAGLNGNGNIAQNVVLSHIGLTVQAELTDNVSTKLKFVNEGLWGTSATSGSLNVDTEYVTMKEMLYSPLTVVVGRQPLAYGNQFLIGDGDAAGIAGIMDLTGGVNFDAVKAVLSYDPLTVDLFAAKIDAGTTTVTDDRNQVNLYGVNANYKVGDSMNTVVEAYTFAKLSDVAATPASTETKSLYVPGLRVSTNPIEGLNVQLEGAYEFGQVYADSHISAFALQGMVNYALPVMKNMKPVLSGSYTYLSGDKNKDYEADHNNYYSTKNAWIDLYSNQNVGRIYKTLFANSNLSVFNAAVELTPIQDVTTKLSWYGLYEAVKTAGGHYEIAQPDMDNHYLHNKRSTRLGNEIDLDLTYAYTEDVKFGLSAGVFLTGTKLSNVDGNDATNQSQMAKQLLTSVNVAF